MYLLVIIFVMICYILLIILDAYLKHNHFLSHADETVKISNQNKLLGIDVTPDYLSNLNRHFIYSVRWGILFPFSTVLVLVMTWMLYFSFSDDVLARRKVVQAEIKGRNEEISRN